MNYSFCEQAVIFKNIIFILKLISYIYDIRDRRIEMAEPKKDLFTEEEQSMANFARVLSHPARIKILKILNDLNGCIVAEMVERLPLAQSTISQHLEELKKAGLIRSEVEGPKRYYCLNQTVVLKAKSKLDKLFSNICTCC